ncbi:ABC transporter ATP-binding protein, partial [bacterium]
MRPSTRCWQISLVRSGRAGRCCWVCSSAASSCSCAAGSGSWVRCSGARFSAWGAAALLQTRSLSKRFGAHTAVDAVDLDVRAGTLHSIIGPNGAGKTTLFNLITGDLSPSAGEIVFQGQPIAHLDSARRSRLGIGRSFQRTNIFPHSSVLENVRIAAQSRSSASFDLWRPARSLHRITERAHGVLEEIGLAGHAGQLASELAGGDQRLLELAIALATEPTLLLLDEPSQGLSPEDAKRLMGRIRALSARYTILLIEHNVGLVME